MLEKVCKHSNTPPISHITLRQIPNNAWNLNICNMDWVQHLHWMLLISFIIYKWHSPMQQIALSNLPPPHNIIESDMLSSPKYQMQLKSSKKTCIAVIGGGVGGNRLIARLPQIHYLLFWLISIWHRYNIILSFSAKFRFTLFNNE